MYYAYAGLTFQKKKRRQIKVNRFKVKREMINYQISFYPVLIHNKNKIR